MGKERKLGYVSIEIKFIVFEDVRKRGKEFKLVEYLRILF